MINEQPKKKSALLPVSQLHTFEGHPYKVLDNEEMDSLVESIKEQGILSPLIVRPLENGEYEVISGHRRLHAAEKAGLTEVPALIYPLDRIQATMQERLEHSISSSFTPLTGTIPSAMMTSENVCSGCKTSCDV